MALHLHMAGMADARRCGYVVGLKASRARVDHVHPDVLVRRMLAEYGWAQLFEWYRKDMIGKVVFDVDGEVSAAAGVTARTLLRAALAGVDTFFGFTPARVVIASSHAGEADGDKVSFRIFVPGYRMLIADVKKRVLRLELNGKAGGPFDPAIYGANQKLRMVGSIKTPEDRRVLKLVDAQQVDVLPTHALLLDTLVQVVDDGWPLLTEVVSKCARPIPDTAVAVCPAPKRQRGRPPKACCIPPDVLAVLLDMHYVEPRFVSATAEGFAFDAKNRDRCPNCGHDHERQNWWCIPKEDETVVANYSERCVVKSYPRVVEAIVPAHANFEDSLALLALDGDQADKLRGALHYHQTVVEVACYRPECMACDRHHDCTTYTARQIIPRHCWTVRNDDNSCRGRIFHHTSRLADKLHSLFTSPDEESLIGLFLEGHVGTIHVERHTRTTYLWDCAPSGGGRWRKLTATEFESHVGLWLNTLLQGIAGLAEFKDHEKAVKLARGKVTPGGIAKLKQQIQGRISLQALQGGRQEAVMDGNPHLLGAGASVVELKARDGGTGEYTTLLRHARPEDLVTKSVGYDIPEEGFGDTAAVEAVFAQIYPVEEERHFFQLYGGYCLLGNNPAKGFMCLTDRRKGDNGKSTAVRLLRRALGDDYVIDNKQNLLYEARYSSNVNAHDSGMLAFDGKRLAIMEELSASRTLDTSVMKQLTGGEARISVRAAGAAETRAMAWSAKLIAVFNEGCAPRFKTEDDAFTKRMMVMPHRAFFCKDAVASQTHAGEEHTFDADGAKIEALEAEPWRILAWFLTGLERYWASGKVEFQAPHACREWAGALVEEQDVLKAWLVERISVGDNGDFIAKSDLEAALRVAGISFQPMQLKKRVEELFKSGGAHTKTNHRSGGIKYSTAWMQLRWNI